ncbi:hypothetical protein F5Y13DRAFT_28310 [Hypoxylon sp. FL1857]|nr:hypothetical protein F5Y13DRAFT_28310 [Hypoxylon sp. FL1857]
MSSTTGLSRTRSIRQPTAGRDRVNQRDGPTTRSDARTVSPSRLPVKPTMTTRSAAASAATSATTTTTSRTRAASSTTGRPLSGVYSKAPSTRTDYGNGAAKPLGRAASTRQAPSSTTAAPPVTRSASTATRPRSSGGPPPTTASNRLASHSRSKSTVTSLTAATTLRPVSQVSSSSSGGRTSPTASTITAASSRHQTRSQTHGRTKSQPQARSISGSTTTTTATATTTTTTRPPSKPPTGLTKRPAFNTHQQHYSPAKSLAPKPLTSTFLAPPSPSKLPANVAISAETSRLQTELLQLSLLHRDAAAVDAEWHASARAKLEARFARLSADNKALLSLERQGVEARNVGVLARWGGDSDNGRGGRAGGGLGLEEKVQILDEALNGVWQLGEPGGRYQRVVAGFEAWAERMASIVSAQRSGNLDVLVDGEEVRFLGELDTGWKHDCVSLLRKLEGWSAALRELGDVSSVASSTGSSSEPSTNSGSGSGLERMVSGCRALVHDMLAELELMAQIERDAARAEDEWIESMNKAIEDEDDDTPAARAYVPLWKLAT